MDALEQFFRTVTPAQAELVSSASGVVSVLLAAFLAPIVFHIVTRRGVATFEQAVTRISGAADTVDRKTAEMSDKLVEINALLSAVTQNQAIAQAKTDDLAEEEVRSLATPSGRAMDPNSPIRTKLIGLWAKLRARLEEIASEPKIDGRTRAKFARIDRRDYVALLSALEAESLLGDKHAKWRRAVTLWYTYRPNNQILDDSQLAELEALTYELAGP